MVEIRRGSNPFLSREEIEREADRIQTVFLLLNQLARREEATVKEVLDCLYDIGSVRLIKKRVPLKILQWPLKGIASVSKPVFRIFAWRWFIRNTPRLITQWLHTQVKFDVPDAPDLESGTLIDVTPVRPELPPILEKQAAEIYALRNRVGILTGLLILVLIVGIALLMGRAG